MEILSTFSLLTIVIITVIVFLTVYFHGPGYSPHIANFAPASLTSLGIFGTFLGIAIGLFEFDINNIQTSVPSLLLGLKTAFWSSVVGLAGALSLKVRQLIVVSRTQELSGGNEIESMVLLLGEVCTELKLFRESSQVSQRAIESASTDGLNRLNSSIETHFDRIVEVNTHALVEALERVMHDFNGKINTQYGENFKQLNLAVGEMVTWQQEYRSQIMELCSRFSKISGRFEQASQAFEALVENSQSFKGEVEGLSGMIGQLTLQRSSLETHIEKFSMVIEHANAGLPNLESRIADLTGVLVKEVSSSSKEMSTTMQQTCKHLKSNMSEMLGDLSESLRLVQNQMLNHTEDSIARVEKQSMDLDRAMEEELTKALRTFGSQLTALSEKFVDDYTPLTEKLRNVLQIAS